MPGERFITSYNEDPEEALNHLKCRLKEFSLILRVRSKIFKGLPDFTVDTLELLEDNILKTPSNASLSITVPGPSESRSAKKKLTFSDGEPSSSSVPMADFGFVWIGESRRGGRC